MTIHLLARTCTVSGILLAAFSLCPIAQAQNGAPNPVFTQPGGQVNTTASVDFNTPPPDPAHEHMLRKMVKERNMIRQQTIVDDTNHLLDLAKQLKDAVDKSNKDQLSLSVVNTASEIEKLAKAVKEKMRDGE